MEMPHSDSGRTFTLRADSRYTCAMHFEVTKNSAHVEQNGRVRFLVDGAEYFDELADVLEQAENTILIAGWAIDPKCWLRPQNAVGARLPLQTFLRRLVAAKPTLTVYLLIWDMSETYRFSTNPWSIFQKGWLPHPRIRLVYDDHYPFGGCQHQKFVVIDDEVAFCGGIDVTTGRWDTPEHLVDDPRRIDAYGLKHGPFHDLQIRVSGESAAYLGRLFRQRWRRVSVRRGFSNRVRKTPIVLAEGVEARKIAISRTDPVTRPPTEEVRQMAHDLMFAAKKRIYIENQYLTSRELGEALARRLEEPDGPEVIVVGPRQPAGWVEEVTVGVLRWRVVDSLRAADRHHRLRIVYPMASVSADVDVYVHAKLMIVDDRWVRIGSSNISRRSMTLDTEVDVTVEVDEVVGRELQVRLVAEHLGLPASQVAEDLEVLGSLRATLDRLQGVSDRTLLPLGKGPALTEREFAQDGDVLFDPAEPWELAALAEVFAGRQAGRNILETAPAGFVTIALTSASLTLWRLFFWDNFDWVEQAYAWAIASPFPAGIVLGLSLGVGLSAGLSTFIALLISHTVLGIFWGTLVVWLASILAAGLSYHWGTRFGRNAATKLFGERVQEVRRRLFSRGVFSVVALRSLPVSAFATVGFAAGAGDVPFRTYLIGSIVGVLPNLMLLGVAAYATSSFMTVPSFPGFLAMVVSVVFIGALTRTFLRAFERRENRKRSETIGRYDTIS